MLKFILAWFSYWQFKRHGYPLHLKYDVSYGIYKHTGWTLVIDGSNPFLDGQFLPTREDAILHHINYWKRSHPLWRLGPGSWKIEDGIE